MNYQKLSKKQLISEIERLKKENIDDVALKMNTKDIVKELNIAYEALDSSLSGILVTDNKNRITYCNPAFLEMFGFDSSEQLLQLNLPKLIELWGLKKYEKQIFIDNKFSGFKEMAVSRNDGEQITFLISFSNLKDRHENIAGRKLSFVDTTESKKLKNELSMVHDTLNASLSAILMTDLKGEIIYINNTFLRLFEYNDENEILGKKAVDIFISDRVKKFSDVKAIIDSKRGETEEFTVHKKDGSKFPVEVLSTNVTDNDNTIIGRMASFYDITDLKLSVNNKKSHPEEAVTSPHKSKTLKGFLSICSSCKRIKLDNNEWEEIELYIKNNSDLDFTHGICPECATKIYPEYFHEKNEDEEYNTIKKQLLEIRNLNDVSMDVIEDAAGDSNTTAMEKKKYENLKKHIGDNIYKDFLFKLTHQHFPADESRRHWYKIIEHKDDLSKKLDRNVGISVATMDYLTNIKEKLEEPRIITDSKMTTITEIALLDGLTKLYDHLSFREMLGIEIKRYKRHGSMVSLIMIDIDDFKNINDTYGHEKGDEILSEIALLLQNLTRDLDKCARYGGEEFMIILPQTDSKETVEMAERIRGTVEKKYKGNLDLTISIGVATCPGDAVSADELIKCADDCLYLSKRKGKNRVTTYSEYKNHPNKTT